MYSELLKKDNQALLKCLQRLGKNRKVYSKCCEGQLPMLEDKVTYVYATESEMAVVVVEPESSQQDSDRDALAWGLEVSCEMIRIRMLRLSRHIPFVFGIIVTGDATLSLPVNPDDELPIAFPLSFIFQAEYTGADIEFANDRLCEQEGYTEPLSQAEIAAQMGICLEDFGLVSN